MDGKVIKLSEDEVRLFQRLSQSRDGKKLVAFLKRLRSEWSDLSLLTVESFAARKDAIQLLDANLLSLLENSHTPKESGKNNYI